MIYRGFTLDPFQADAIEALQRGETVLVCAPTGTGKTVVADWMVEDVLRRGQQVVYTAPIKALSNQKFRDYCKLLGDDKVGLVTGDLVIRPDAPCRVMTTEILRNQLLQGAKLPELAAVIVDEIHFLDDPERGTTWEELLIYLPEDVQIVGLSATLSNLEEFADWLRTVVGHDVTVVEEYRRAVPLSFRVATQEGGLLDPDEMARFYDEWHKRAARRGRAGARSKGGGDRGRGGRRDRGRRDRGRGDRGRGRWDKRGRGQGRGGGRFDHDRLGHPTRHGDVFGMLAPSRLPYLYFVNSRKDAEALARSLAIRVGRVTPSLLEDDDIAAVDDAIAALRATAAGAQALDDDLADLYRMGIAFHHAGLHVSLKALVEELYERHLVNVLYCTGTFALGINMPARCAVFDRLERYNGREMIPLPAREFMQMAGRAGRRGMDSEGVVVVRCDIDDWPAIKRPLARYLRGETEEVRSRFSLSLHSVVNLLEQHDEDHMRALVDMSFLAFHRAHRAAWEERKAASLAQRLADQGWREGKPVPRSLKKDVQQLRRLKVRATERTERTWDELQAKLSWLERWGYIRRPEEGDADDEITPSGWVLGAGANILRKMAFQEVFATELVLAGVLEQVSMPELFGILSGMVNRLPKGVYTSEGRSLRGLGRHVSRIRHSDAVTSSEQITRQEVTWDPDMIVFGKWWAEGRSLAEIMLFVRAPTDISGELIGAFRRARDLLGQLKLVYLDHDPDRAEQMAALLRDTRRDEVEVLD